MGIESLTTKKAQVNARTLKKLRVPAPLVQSICRIRDSLTKDGIRKSFEEVLLELADEGTKAFRAYEARARAAGDAAPLIT